MPGGYIGSAFGGNGGSIFGATTASLDTTGANLLVVAVAYLDNTSGAITAADIFDSEGNTWQELGNYVPSSGRNVNSALRMFYCENPSSVGPGHTATVASGFVIVPAIGLAAFSGAVVSGVLNGETGDGPVTPVQINAINTSALTPSLNDCLLVAAAAQGDSRSGSAIDNGFTIAGGIAGVPGVCFGVEMAYLIQTSAGLVNPQFSGTSPDYRSAAIAAFNTPVGTPPIEPARIIFEKA